MNRTTRLAAGCLLLLVGCWGGCEQASNVPNEPACVIDFWIVSAVVKIDTTTGNPATYFTLFLIYHFIGKPGTVDYFSLHELTDPWGGGWILEPINPTPIGVRSLINWEFKDTRTFPGHTSVFVRLELGGRFWERAGNRIIDCGTFTIEDIKSVSIQR